MPTQSANRVRHARRALSLVELAIVVLIIGILAAVTGPKVFDSMNTAQVRGAAKCVIADIELARQNAMTQGADQAIVFDAATDSYTLTGMDHPDRPGQAFAVDLSAGPYPATITSVSFGVSGTGTGVTFNQFGRPDVGGWVYLEAGGVTQTIMVDGVAGRAMLWP